MKGSHACPMCGVYVFNPKHSLSDRLYKTTDEVFRIVECRGCGLLRLDPRPEEDKMEMYYPDRYWVYGGTRKGLAGIYRSFVLRDHLRFVKKAVKRMGKKQARILDIGCGAGDLLGALRKLGHAGIGLDISESALKSAAELQVPGVRADYDEPPFADGSFDVVSMFHVLEHVPDPDYAIAVAVRLLNPNGRLVVQVPNADCMQYAILGRFWIGLDVPRHTYAYRRLDLEQLFQRNGLVITRRKYFSWRDNAPSLATSLAPWLDPMSRRVRRPKQANILRLCGDLAYFALTLACWPFAIFESIFRRGATIMVEGEKTESERAEGEKTRG